MLNEVFSKIREALGLEEKKAELPDENGMKK